MITRRETSERKTRSKVAVMLPKYLPQSPQPGAVPTGQQIVVKKTNICLFYSPFPLCQNTSRSMPLDQSLIVPPIGHRLMWVCLHCHQTLFATIFCRKKWYFSDKKNVSLFGVVHEEKLRIIFQTTFQFKDCFLVIQLVLKTKHTQLLVICVYNS